MSEFSGKCDFKDTIDIWGADAICSSNIYLYEQLIPLRIDTEKDLIPYYPYIVISAAMSKTGKNEIHLSKESYVDSYEKDLLTNILKNHLKKHRKCKRDHVIFNPEPLLYLHEDEEIINRIKRDGEKATIDNIHLTYCQYYRDLLYREMVFAGYEPTKAYYWVYKVYDDTYKQLFEERISNEQ